MTGGEHPDPGGAPWTLAVYALLGAISLVPILLFDHPPFTDHPNHLARLHVLNAAPGSPLAAVYEPAWALIPNLASDLLGVLLHPWLAPERVLQLVAALGMGGALLGVALLQRRLFGAFTPSLWLAPLLLFNIATSMGYVNYFLGVAVALLATHLWLVLEERPLWLRALAFNAIGAILFFCHVTAVALFGVVAASYELFRLRGLSAPGALARWAASLAATFALPAVLVLLAERPDHIFSFSYADKARVLLAATYANHWTAFLPAFVALALLLYELARSRRLRVAPSMRPILAVLALLVLLLPSQFSRAIDLDSRTAVCLAFLFVASTRIASPSRHRVRVLAAVTIAVVSLRSLLIADAWRDWSGEVADFRAGLAGIEPGAAVLVGGWRLTDAEADCDGARPDAMPTAWHLPSFAVIDRGAFVPLLFTAQGMQPIRAAPRYRGIDIGVSGPVPPDLLDRAARPAARERLRRDLEEHHTPGYFLDWPRRFDYLLFLHHGCPAPLFPQQLSEIGSGDLYTLYRIRPAAARAPDADAWPRSGLPDGERMRPGGLPLDAMPQG